MRVRLSLLVVCLISLRCCVSAQQPNSLELLDLFPSCAVSNTLSFGSMFADLHQQRCLINEFLTQSCSPTNTTCICMNQEFQSSVAFCVTSNCTIPEALCMASVFTQNLASADMLSNSNQKYQHE